MASLCEFGSAHGSILEIIDTKSGERIKEKKFVHHILCKIARVVIRISARSKVEGGLNCVAITIHSSLEIWWWENKAPYDSINGQSFGAQWPDAHTAPHRS